MADFVKHIELLLEEKIGLSVNAVGRAAVQRAVSQRMNVCGILNESDYLRCLERSDHELGELTELVIVPETRFFRNQESFEFLSSYIASDRVSRNFGQMLRILSIPCASGEEPYSIIITLTDAGFPDHKFQIDAADISQRLINKAAQGIYATAPFNEKYYRIVNHSYQLNDNIRQKVRWIKGNLSDSEFLKNESPYHIIFCRNLMIYLNNSARRKGIENIIRLLEPNGLLFVGHAEHGLFADTKLTRLNPPKAFVFQKVTEVSIVKEIPLNQPSTNDGGQEESKTPIQKVADNPPLIKEIPLSKENSIESIKLYADQGNLKQAVEICRLYLTAHPTDIEAHFLMGLMMKAGNDDAGAEKWLSKVLYLDPKHEDALHYLSVILEKRGDINGANNLKQRAERARELKK